MASLVVKRLSLAWVTHRRQVDTCGEARILGTIDVHRRDRHSEGTLDLLAQLLFGQPARERVQPRPPIGALTEDGRVARLFGQSVARGDVALTRLCRHVEAEFFEDCHRGTAADEDG